MKYDIHVDDDVYAMLRDTEAWYADRAQSSDVGAKWRSGFLEALRALSDNPFQFALARESTRFPYDLRELLYGSGRRKTHRALFRIVDDRVEVLAIRHVAQRDLTADDL